MTPGDVVATLNGVIAWLIGVSALVLTWFVARYLYLAGWGWWRTEAGRTVMGLVTAIIAILATSTAGRMLDLTGETWFAWLRLAEWVAMTCMFVGLAVLLEISQPGRRGDRRRGR